MGRLENFGGTQDVAITVLVDNTADLLVKSTDTVKRYTDEPLLAEHGFAVLIDLVDAGVRILWDAGVTQIALVENAKRMDAGYRVPLIAHPAAFRERWWIGKDGKKHGPRIVPRDEWQAVGADIILSEGPHELGPGCWTTGAVPRQSFEKAGTPPAMAYRQGDEFIRDHLDDDQSIIINVRHKGLVVLTGCAHAGIINTVNYAREISGVNSVWAIMGGFHLATAKDEEIQRTIDEIKKLQPAMVVPSHCTGFKAITQFAQQMPDQFVLGVVGTRYLF
jgi:7,8-dihydropterin-6-yl-methyl-4-(beta-D-ribofuranosyl)aminobenzene 5'-phosphate synthase